MLKKIFKFFLILVILAALTLLAIWGVMVRHYPWWVFFSMAIGLLGLWLAWVFIRRKMLRRKEADFVGRVIVEDEKAIAAAPPDQQAPLRELQLKWKKSVELLRGSYLRKRGNPLYVLPWFMVIGESGVGKTSAIKNTNLNSPISGDESTVGISVTRNCDWWFFEEAIILDTAGRYTIPLDESLDLEEWKEFLTLLAKYRKREPINGVILAVSADQLLELNEAKLSDSGKTVRRHIDQLMRILCARFPVYVLVTKLDLVQGMVEFSSGLPRPDMDQAMGYINRDLDSNWSGVLNKAMERITDNLKDLRLVLVHQQSEPEPEVFLFINEFERLRYGLELFVQSVFDTNPYQETPMLRGVFFSSAIQQRSVEANSSRIFGMDEKEMREKVHHNGIFLKDLFKRILPRDRDVFRPIREYDIWRRLTRNLGLASWILIWGCLAGLLSFSFIKNGNALDTVTADGYHPAQMTADTEHNLVALDTLRLRLKAIHESNSRWFLPRMRLEESLEVENVLRTHYLILVPDWLVAPLDKLLSREIQRTRLPERESLQLIEYLRTRIEILDNAINGRENIPPDSLQAEAAPLITSRGWLSAEHVPIFARVYLDYLSRVTDREALILKREQLQNMLDLFLAGRGDLGALLKDAVSGVPDVKVSQFWGDEADLLDADTTLAVPGFYTSRARIRIEKFFSDLKSVSSDPQALDNKIASFWDNYSGAYCDAWAHFAGNFDRGIIGGGGQASARRRAAVLMATETNPYFSLMEYMARELDGLEGKTAKPPWAVLTLELNGIIKDARLVRDTSKLNILGKLKGKTDNLIKDTFGRVDRQAAHKVELKQRAAKAYNEYVRSLEAMGSSLTNRQTCFQLISDYYDAVVNTSQSACPLYDAKLRCDRIKYFLKDSGDQPMVWDIMLGPQRFVLDYSLRETACDLQARWESEVLGGLKGVGRDELLKTLFAQGSGLAWKFVYNTARPFIQRESFGYVAKRRNENLLHFEPDFLEFLTSGEAMERAKPPDSYPVTLETLPLGVNDEAKLKPYACYLSVQGAQGPDRLENYNFPQQQTFNWDPNNFGETVLQIVFPAKPGESELSLSRNWPGQLGFAEFLRDYKDGSRVFKASDFPQAEAAKLKELDVSWISVAYRIQGAQPVIDLLTGGPPDVPVQIIECWTGESDQVTLNSDY